MHCYSAHPVMLSSRQAEKLSNAPLNGLTSRGQRAACFAVLFFLLSVAMVLVSPNIHKKENSATPPPFSDPTPAKDFSVPAARFDHHLSFLGGSSVPLKNHASTVRASLAQRYGQTSLAFEANQGQIDSRVKFLSRGAGYSLFLTQDEAVVVLRTPTVDPVAQTAGFDRTLFPLPAPGLRRHWPVAPITPP